MILQVVLVEEQVEQEIREDLLHRKEILVVFQMVLLLIMAVLAVEVLMRREHPGFPRMQVQEVMEFQYLGFLHLMELLVLLPVDILLAVEVEENIQQGRLEALVVLVVEEVEDGEVQLILMVIMEL